MFTSISFLNVVAKYPSLFFPTSLILTNLFKIQTFSVYNIHGKKLQGKHLRARSLEWDVWPNGLPNFRYAVDTLPSCGTEPATDRKKKETTSWEKADAHSRKGQQEKFLGSFQEFAQLRFSSYLAMGLPFPAMCVEADTMCDGNVPCCSCVNGSWIRLSRVSMWMTISTDVTPVSSAKLFNASLFFKRRHVVERIWYRNIGERRWGTLVGSGGMLAWQVQCGAECHPEQENTNCEYCQFLIGRLHRFLGPDVQRQRRRGDVLPGRIFHTWWSIRLELGQCDSCGRKYTTLFQLLVWRCVRLHHERLDHQQRRPLRRQTQLYPVALHPVAVAKQRAMRKVADHLVTTDHKVTHKSESRAQLSNVLIMQDSFSFGIPSYFVNS